jgi:hypothetical protein
MTILRHIDDILHVSSGAGHKIGSFISGVKSGANPLSWGNLKHTNTELLGPKLGEHTSGFSKYHEVSQQNPNRVHRTLSDEEYNKYTRNVIHPHNTGVKAGASGLAATTGTALSGLENTSKPPEIVSNLTNEMDNPKTPIVGLGVAAGLGGYAMYKQNP